MSDLTTVQVVLSSESVVGAPTAEAVTVLGTVPVGPRGPAGPQGPEGPAGPAATTYVHEQGTASADWDITHGRGGYPSVTAQDSAGTPLEGQVEYVTDDRLILHLKLPTGGVAYLN